MWRCAGCEKVGNRRTPLSPKYACSKALNKLNLFIYTLSDIIEFIISSVKVAVGYLFIKQNHSTDRDYILNYNMVIVVESLVRSQFNFGHLRFHA